MNPLHEAQAGAYPCPPGILTDTWHSEQVTPGYVSITDALAELIRFSGCPDRVEIWVRDNDAIVAMVDEQGRDGREVLVPVGVFYEPGVHCRAVWARNAISGLTARVQAVGKWRRTPMIPAQEAKRGS
ncbi:MAG: hypothetical protein WAP47_01210 [Candidatus Rokuibacteriota bacterium]